MAAKSSIQSQPVEGTEGSGQVAPTARNPRSGAKPLDLQEDPTKQPGA